MPIITFPPQAQGGDTTLAPYFGWAGSSFPYAGDADVTIAADTEWDDIVGFKKVRKLTINAGIKLKIARSPFFIFADEIVFGSATSVIDGNGPSGDINGTPFPPAYARGATNVVGGSTTQGGCGGIMLFITARKISGAAGIIRANGGDGFFTGSPGTNSRGGQGALSTTVNNQVSQEDFSGMTDVNTGKKTYLHPYGKLLANGGGSSNSNGGGGGSATGSTSSGSAYGGGSGIGGGGAVHATSGDGAASIGLTPFQLLGLAESGCLGGGGGGAGGSSNGAGGGGGGSVVVWARELLVTPALQANGGSRSAGGSAGQGNGGAGVTHLIVV